MVLNLVWKPGVAGELKPEKFLFKIQLEELIKGVVTTGTAFGNEDSPIWSYIPEK